MTLDPDALADRQKEMFREITIPASFEEVFLDYCNECGVVVIDKPAHFGHHLKMDNFDQRIEQALHHRHPTQERIR